MSSCQRCGYTPPSSNQAGLKDPNPYQMACQIFNAADEKLSWEEAMQKAARRVRKEWKQEKKKAKKKLPNGSDDKPVTAKKKKKTTMK